MFETASICEEGTENRPRAADITVGFVVFVGIRIVFAVVAVVRSTIFVWRPN